MTDKADVKVSGAAALAAALRDLAPNMRRGPAQRALRAGAAPVLERAIAETPSLVKPVIRNGKTIRKPGTLRRALRIRTSKDTAKNGDVGVFVNIKPLERSAVRTFKDDTGRRSSENPDDPFYWRFVHFATKKNKNPKPFLTRAGAVLQGESLRLITQALVGYFDRLNKKAGKP
jgi:HK97 gp10 family phage protein